MALERPVLLILGVVAVIALLWPRRPAALAATVPEDVLARPQSGRARLLGAMPLIGLLCAWLAALAAAGPCRGAHDVPDERLARDIALVLDTSESMKATDFAPAGAQTSRMDVALQFATRFIDGRSGDRVAVVAFGSRAITQCPLTFDRDLATSLLAYVKPEALGKRTALGDGLALGVARLPRGGALVLVSDGQNTAGTISPEEAVRAAVDRGVRVYAVGVGGPGPVPIPARMPSGAVRIVQKDYALNEAALRQIAGATGGRYLHASDSAALKRAFAEIDRLEARPAGAVRSVPDRSLAPVAAAAAALLLACQMALSATWLLCVPRLP
jgi:Ca-activated chloride channel family protein